ncbi:MAG: AMP-binding protein [Acidobacteriota bacterium]
MNLCENLLVGARLFADQDAILFEGSRLSYADLERLSGQAAGVLRALGVERGDRVGLIIPNVPAFATWYYAILRLGAIAVSVNTRLAGEEMAFILSDCDARIAVGTEDVLASLRAHTPDCVERTLTASENGTRFDGEALAAQASVDAGWCVDVEPDEPATILYTSGTTGFPKGATLSHGNVRATVHAFNHLCHMVPEDRLLLAVPLFHCFGQNALLNAGFNVGCTLVLQRAFAPDAAKRLIMEHRVTKLFTVPAAFHLLYDLCTPEDLASIHYYFTAAAKMPLQLAQRWQAKFGRPIYEGYGLTETAPFASYNHRLRFVPGSIGTPVDLVDMKIVDPETGETCPPGTPGEIAIRGPNVMLGYWNRPDATADAIRDGWFFSGDIGETDERGYFYIVDRLKDMISVGGLKVFPAEVERVLLDHGDVDDAAVIGGHDAILGETVVAYVVLTSDKPDAAEAIRGHCQAHLASYKVPARIVFVDQLPRNPSGKVLKTTLRARDQEAQADEATLGAADPARPGRAALADLPPEQRHATLRAWVRQETAEAMGVAEDTLVDTVGFAELGMDSIHALDLSGRLQTRFELPLPSTVSFDFPTVESLTAFLAERLFDPVADASGAPRDPVTATASADPALHADVEQMSEDEVLSELMGNRGRSDD